jgi:hypothetical protein
MLGYLGEVERAVLLSAGRARCVLALVAVALVAAIAPSTVSAACPTVDESYTGPCGPQFTVPSWGDGGGWTDKSKYSTIQLADINGDGRDELLARNDQGLEILWFDTTLGQWRPQVDANGVPQALQDFRSPLPSDEGMVSITSQGAPNWKQPYYYSTIQTGDLDGEPGVEVAARFPRGMRAYKFSPPTGTDNVDGGTWQVIATRGPFADPGGFDPGIYSAIHVARLSSDQVPVVFGRARSTAASQATLVESAVNPPQLGWNILPNPSGTITDQFSDANCGQPACYLNIQAANLAPDDSGLLNTIVSRTRFGVSAWDLRSSTAIDGSGTDPMHLGPFADVRGPECPFSTSGASGPGSSDCLGSGPGYYETLRGANIDGQPGEELLALGSDGLRVRKWVPPSGAAAGSFQSMATLTDLAGAATVAGRWGSIRTGDILGIGRDQVLALDDQGRLQAWSYDPAAKAWAKLAPTTALDLGTDFLDDPSYYSTIRVGDVDGDGHADVLARGQLGIRTWFYDRRGTGGWERYLPEGYPAFSPTQQAAFAKLTDVAKTNQRIPLTATTVRDVWASENTPTVDLNQLQRDLAGASVGNCSGPGPANPPSYEACTPPADSTGFTGADWTAVVNQMLAEAYAAGQVVVFFDELDKLREHLLIAEGAALPAIGSDLGLQAASGTSASFSSGSYFAGATGIAASIAGLFDPEVSAALWVASEIVSMLPSASPAASDTFQSTYAGLQDEFAQMADEADKAIRVQSQDVRQDAGLLLLVGQLRARGTWDLDAIGMASAARQAFATWTYRSLMPRLYWRYDITRCETLPGIAGAPPYYVCSGPSFPTTGVLGGGSRFITIGPPPDFFEVPRVPCVYGRAAYQPDCSYTTPPSDLMNRIWGPVSDSCNYQPGKAQTAWTFGCSAGVDPRASIGLNTWSFGSSSGSPDIWSIPTSASSAVAAQTAPQSTITLGRRSIGRRAGRSAHARLRSGVSIPRGLRLAGATVRLDRLLFHRAGRDLAGPRRRRAARRLTLKRTARGTFVARTRSRPRARLVLRRVGRRPHFAVTLQVRRATLRPPRPCAALPAAVGLATPRVELETRLRISDGDTRRTLRFTHHWRCKRDALGNVSKLVSVRNRRPPARTGLAVRLQGPRRVHPGTTARFVAVVRNRRTGRRRERSSLWHVTLDARHARTLKIRELRRGRARTLRFTRRVPRNARGRFCVNGVATAAGARAASVRLCVPILGA